jgi:hypothetical protein
MCHYRLAETDGSGKNCLVCQLSDIDKPIAMIPSTICAIRIPLGEITSAFNYWAIPH